MSFRFKPSDFTTWNCHPALDIKAAIAEKANQLLDEYVQSLPEVFGSLEHDTKEIGWSRKKIKTDTHRARLWGVEEITQKKCNHVVVDVEYSRMMPGVEGWIGKCEKCGRLMSPKWEEA